MKMQVSGGIDIDDIPRKQLKAGAAIFGNVEIRVKDEPHKRATASSGNIEHASGSLKTLIPLSGDEAEEAAARFSQMSEIAGQQTLDDAEDGDG